MECPIPQNAVNFHTPQTLTVMLITSGPTENGIHFSGISVLNSLRVVRQLKGKD